MPVYSLYSFHRTFIPGFEYLTPSGFQVFHHFLTNVTNISFSLWTVCQISLFLDAYRCHSQILPGRSFCKAKGRTHFRVDANFTTLTPVPNVLSTEKPGSHRSLYSNMVLLILTAADNVLIPVEDLHFNMVLLILCDRVKTLLSFTVFTFQYGSINTNIQRFQLSAHVSIYISIWFY